MSDKDRKRAEAGIVFRNGKLITAEEAKKYEKPPAEEKLLCLKCQVNIPYSKVEQHIMECQDGIAECGKCHDMIPAVGFLEHYKNCNGKKKEDVEKKDEV